MKKTTSTLLVILSLACAGVGQPERPTELGQLTEEVERLSQEGNGKVFDRALADVSVPTGLPALEDAYLDTVAGLHTTATALKVAVTELRPPAGTNYSDAQLSELNAAVEQVYADSPETREKPVQRSGACQDAAAMTGLDPLPLCHLQSWRGTNGLHRGLKSVPDLINGAWVDLYFSLDGNADTNADMFGSGDVAGAVAQHLHTYRTQGANWQVLKEALFPQMEAHLSSLTAPTEDCVYRFRLSAFERVDRYAGQAGMLSSSVVGVRTPNLQLMREEAREIASALSVDGVYIYHVQKMAGTNGLKRVLEQCEGLPDQARLLTLVQ